MRMLVSRAALIVLPSLFVTGLLLAQDVPTTSKATPEEMKRLAGSAKIEGRVGGLAGSSITVIIPDERQYRAAMNRINGLRGQAREDAMKQINMISRGKEYEIELSEKCSLRKSTLPFEFDDKGFKKTYTALEMQKLKGTGPGYTASPDDIAPGLGVTVNLTRDKKDSNKPLATMIFVNNVQKKQ